jgi:outer membrane biosynthesis protein TonB
MNRKCFATLGALGLATVVTVTLHAHEQTSADPQQATRLAQASPAPVEHQSRPARPQEVRVRVLLLSSKPRKDDPDEYVEVDGVRYIHFRSPNLKSPARPLNEPRLLHPANELVHKNGAVIVQLLIDEQGAVTRIDAVCAAPAFEKSALESVRGLKFQPAVAREGPVKSYMLVEFGYGKGYPCGRIPN